jgi:hypothetical protein
VHWRGAAKAAAIALASLFALQVLPGLLAPPQPPAPAADVGLPRVGAAALEPPPHELAPHIRPAKPRFETDAHRPKGTTEQRAKPDRRVPRFETDDMRAKGTTERAAADVATPEQAATVVAASPVAPPPAAAPPGDGSEEFAPR